MSAPYRYKGSKAQIDSLTITSVRFWSNSLISNLIWFNSFSNGFWASSTSARRRVKSANCSRIDSFSLSASYSGITGLPSSDTKWNHKEGMPHRFGIFKASKTNRQFFISLFLQSSIVQLRHSKTFADSSTLALEEKIFNKSSKRRETE